MKKLLEARDLDLGKMEDIARAIPGRDPELEVTIRRIPVSEFELARKFIPVCEPYLAGNEERYVRNCVRTNWISSAGRYIQDFEQLFAQACQTQYAAACANGTVALHLALAALDIGPGDEVIIPTFTMIATANAVTYTGAKPVLVDSEMETWNMDVAKIEEKITPRTKAIMVVHTYGHPVDMDVVMDIARRHDLWVVEDAAEAHGAEYKGHRVGSLGDAACFSFYANKIITTGEGGMITTNNSEIARLTQVLRDHAFSEERHFWHRYLGYNYRMTNLQAAIGLAQAEQFEELVNLRRRNARYYTELLKDVPGITTPPEKSWARSVFWMYSILVEEEEFGIGRDELRQRLAHRGIETRTFFIPMHWQPIYYQAFQGERYPIAEALCRRGMYLPSASSLDKATIEYIVENLIECRKG